MMPEMLHLCWEDGYTVVDERTTIKISCSKQSIVLKKIKKHIINNCESNVQNIIKRQDNYSVHYCLHNKHTLRHRIKIIVQTYFQEAKS